MMVRSNASALSFSRVLANPPDIACYRPLAARGSTGTPEQWASSQFAGNCFGDERLRKRACDLMATLAAKPADSIPGACNSWAETKGAYRFFANEKVTVEKIVGSVAQETARRCGDYQTVLAVQDTTSVSFPKARATEGLHPLGSLDIPALLVHSTVALAESGLPLGILGQLIWTRDPAEKDPEENRKHKPIEEKESIKWIRGMESARLALEAGGTATRLIHVGDRESDVHEVFQNIVCASEGAVIRCSQNRCVKDGEGNSTTVRDAVRQSPLLACRTLKVPRKHGQQTREARVELRACVLELDPRAPYHETRQPVMLQALEVWEPDAPQGVQPLHWLLWTTEPVSSAGEALRVVDIYCKRWKIEEFHLALKSGCRIEALRLRTGEGIAKVVAFYSPLALRIVHLRDLARTTPDAPCTQILRPDEWRALWAYIHKEAPRHDEAPPSMRQAALWIGRIGGHLGRKSDAMPGVRTLWRGWRDLEIMAEVYQALQR